MKIIGIIAEYNPFHNGHAYQIKKVKEDLQADFVVVAMSGDYVQRGTPAIADKYTRTKMALGCGADLVMELPVLWATSSAEYFAMAGVTLFDKMRCVDGICFGAETDDLALLSMIAEVLVKEPILYRNALSSYLKEGLSFPVARSRALCDYFAASDAPSCKYAFETVSSILNEPNNILAIEYLKAIKRRNSSMTPHLIMREGAGYHEDKILDTPSLTDIDSPPTASATAIRKFLGHISNENACQFTEVFTSAMPATALEILKDYLSTDSLIQANDFSSILGYRLLTTDSDFLADIGDSTPDIANRLFKNRMSFSSFEQFCELCKSKDVTYTRMSRVLLHFILGITNQDYLFGKELDYIPYLRILGFRKDASSLLKELKSYTNVPIISKLADASSYLDENVIKMLKADIFAADLYEQICAYKCKKTPKSEYAQEIILVSF